MKRIPDNAQLEKFKEAARELETDDDEARFDEKLRRITKPKATIVHSSDCAVNSAPAFAPGPCDCGALKAER